jgi:branched-chain amino acid transport system ATP-binding protein
MNIMLAIEKLQVAYGKVQALWDVTLGVPDGEIVALVGANGAGKTTLLKTVSGLLRRQSGSITYDGKHIEEASPPEIVQHGLVHVPEGRKLFPELTVIDNLLMGAFTVPQSGRPQRLERVFDIFPVLKERKKQIAGTLSGGEQQMVAIGRGLMGGPKLLMLDEPSLGLAPILVEEVFRVITEINRLGVTVLLVEQNTQNALSLAHKGFVMELGRIALSGSGSELLANSNVRKAYLGL